MRKILSMALLIGGLGLVCQAQAANVENVFIQTYAQVVHKAEKDPSFWPGLKLDSKPTVLKVCTGNLYSQDPKITCHLYAFHFKPKSNNWQKVMVGKEEVYYSPNDSYDIKAAPYSPGYLYGMKRNAPAYDPSVSQPSIIKKPYMMIDEQLSFVSVINLESQMTYTGNILEKVMGILGQRLLAHALTDAPNADARLKQAMKRLHAGYTGFNQSSNVAMFYLEAEIMKAYLKKPDEEKLKNFVAVEMMRKASATDQMLAYEYSDLAGYFAYPAAKLTADVREYVNELFEFYTPSAYEIAHGYGYFTANEYVDHAIDYVSATSMVALEAGDSSWKTLISSKEVSAQELLMQRYSLSEDEIARRVNAMKSQYGFDEMQKVFDGQLTSLAEAQEHLQRYEAMAGVVTHLVIPDGAYFPIYGNYMLDSETALVVWHKGQGVGFGRPYIYLTSLSYMKLQLDKENAANIIEFKLQPEAVVTADDVVTTVANLLATKQVLTFKHLTIQGNDPYNGSMMIGVSSEKGGKVDATRGTLEITR